jgi:hypothetical protein
VIEMRAVAGFDHVHGWFLENGRPATERSASSAVPLHPELSAFPPFARGEANWDWSAGQTEHI